MTYDELPPIGLARTGLLALFVFNGVSGLTVVVGDLFALPAWLAWAIWVVACVIGFLASRTALRWVWTNTTVGATTATVMGL